MDHAQNAANAMDLFLTVSTLAGLIALLTLPALLGQRREWRIDRQLRDAERGNRPVASGDDSAVSRREDVVAIHLTPRGTPGSHCSGGTCTAA